MLHVTEISGKAGKSSGTRESSRLKEPGNRRVLDEATRQRRAKQALEALENDNFHDDPHGDLVANKNVPKFQDTLDPKETRKKKSKGTDYYKFKYRKTLAQMVEYEGACRPDEPNFLVATVPPSRFPKRHFCPVCGFPAPYTCVVCGTRFCSIPCQNTHKETRCLKSTS